MIALPAQLWGEPISDPYHPKLWRIESSRIGVYRHYSPSRLHRTPCYTRVGAESRNGFLDSLIVLLYVRDGVGKHSPYALMRTADFLRILFFEEALYNITITLCKISVLYVGGGICENRQQ